MELLKVLIITIFILSFFGIVSFGAYKEFKELSNPDIVDRYRADLRRIFIIFAMLIFWSIAVYIWFVMVQDNTIYFNNQFNTNL